MFKLDFLHCTSEAEVRKIYRTYAKKFHPDLGGNEEEMKRLNNEFKTTLKRISAEKPESCKSVKIVEDVLSKFGVTSHGIYPGKSMNVTLEYGVDPSKVLKIEAAIREELEKYGTPLHLKYWGTRKSRPYNIFTQGCVTFIDVDAASTYLYYVEQTGSDEEALYKTYAAYVSDMAYGEKWYDAHWDSQHNHGYLMHCSKTLRLSELLATG